MTPVNPTYNDISDILDGISLYKTLKIIFFYLLNNNTKMNDRNIVPCSLHCHAFLVALTKLTTKSTGLQKLKKKKERKK